MFLFNLILSLVFSSAVKYNLLTFSATIFLQIPLSSTFHIYRQKTYFGLILFIFPSNIKINLIKITVITLCTLTVVVTNVVLLSTVLLRNSKALEVDNVVNLIEIKTYFCQIAHQLSEILMMVPMSTPIHRQRKWSRLIDFTRPLLDRKITR